MPIIQSPYSAPIWLRGAHLQTCVPAKLYPRPSVAYVREKVEMSDGDFSLFDWIRTSQASPTTPVLVHFHGLEGSSRSHYALALMQACQQRGWRACVAHFRSCGGETNRQVRSYFAGDTRFCQEVLRIVHERFPHAPLYAVGVSLGANMLAKCLGELGDELSFLRAGISIGAPLDLAAGIPQLARGFGLVYTKMFMDTLKEKLREKERMFPGTFLLKDIDRLRTLEEFDNYYTAPINGFADSGDYYRRNSSKQFLPMVTRPLLLINARNDPFLPGCMLPTEKQVSSSVYLEFSDEGGHIGFPTHQWGDLGYLPGRVMRFIDSLS